MYSFNWPKYTLPNDFVADLAREMLSSRRDLVYHSKPVETFFVPVLVEETTGPSGETPIPSGDTPIPSIET